MKETRHKRQYTIYLYEINRKGKSVEMENCGLLLSRAVYGNGNYL
jgi:hypothetical protein